MVSVIIVTYNGEKFIKKLIESVAEQTFKDIELIVVDNASKDKTVEIISEFREKFDFPYKTIILEKNLGYTGGVNLGIKNSSGDFTLILNQDTYLEKDFIEKALKGFEDKEVGLVSGKILRFDKETIDSTGQFLSLSLYPVERDYNKKASDIERKREIFSVCGAVAFYRRKTLEDIKIDDEYFDKDFFMFFDDIDIGWRANIRGWKGIYVSDAIAYHFRSGTVIKRGKLFLTFKRSPLIQYHIIKNRYLTLLKNVRLSQLLLHLPFIFFRDIVYLLVIIKNPSILKKLLGSAKIFKKAFKKRKKVWMKSY